MIKAACHCGAVRFEISEPPSWVLDCNCTLCRRYGAMWSYYHGERQPMLVSTPDPAATDTYSWQDHDLVFHRCRTCGCVTHFSAADPPQIYAVNARLMVGLDGANVQVRRIDNGHLGWFWTREDEPVMTGRHPPMPPPSPNDWR